jgi:LacI family transcriptional regulator
MAKMSIKSIAETLQISTATVSYILNGKSKEKRISNELSQRVLKYAEDHNYHPNQLAKSLRLGKSQIICLMVEDIADTYFATVAGHIEELAYREGYKIVYCSTKNDTKKTKELISMFRNRNIDGYIIAPPIGIESDIQSLLNDGIPVICFDRFCGDDASYIGLDNFGGAFQATEHLINRNFKNILFCTLESMQNQMLERLEGYEKAIVNANLQSHVLKIPYNKAIANDIEEEIENTLSQNKQIDAIFFATNYLAINGLSLLKKKEIKIGKKIGVLAFDDIDLFRVYQPSITAVSQPIDQIASAVIKLLLGHLSDTTSFIPQKHYLPANLITRESSLPL